MCTSAAISAMGSAAGSRYPVIPAQVARKRRSRGESGPECLSAVRSTLKTVSRFLAGKTSMSMFDLLGTGGRRGDAPPDEVPAIVRKQPVAVLAEARARPRDPGGAGEGIRGRVLHQH